MDGRTDARFDNIEPEPKLAALELYLVDLMLSRLAMGMRRQGRPDRARKAEELRSDVWVRSGRAAWVTPFEHLHGTRPRVVR